MTVALKPPTLEIVNDKFIPIPALEFTISLGKNKFDTNWQPELMNKHNFLRHLSIPRKTKETMLDYDNMNKEERDHAKNGKAFVGGIIKNGNRLKTNVTARTMLTLDADYAEQDFLEVTKQLLNGISHAIYSTHSHRPEKPKYRLIIFVNREMDCDEHEAISRKMAARIGIERFDSTTFDSNRLMYFPSCSKDADPVFEIREGSILNADVILDEYEDWHDPIQWPRHTEEDKPFRQSGANGKVNEDPRKKGGIIGAFCRSYSITEAIEKFIPSHYEAARSSDRFTFTGGSSFGGLLVYNELLAYSHHATDPCHGLSVNAFDLVRLHKFSHMDGVMDIEANKMPSYTAMLAFARRDDLVKVILLEEEFQLPLNPKPGIQVNPYVSLRGKLLDEGYSVNEYGQLCAIKYEKLTGAPYLQPLADFVAWVNRQIIKDNGIDRTLKFEIEGLAAGGAKLKTVKVPSDKFTAMQWAVDSWGARANIRPGASNKDHARFVIQFLGKESSTDMQYGHLGWRKIDDKWRYLHAGGAIGDPSVIVDIKDEGLSAYTFTEETTDLRAAARASLETLNVAPLEVALPLFALTYLAPLCEPLRRARCEPSFIMWLSGTTGTMKSTLAALFLSHFGDFTNKNLPASFKDTANALERKGFFIKDSILVVDDYHPSHSQFEAQKMRSIAEMLLRGYGDRKGRSRLNADATAKQTLIPQGLCVVTGEDHPNGGQSAAARYLGIEILKGQVNKDIMNELQSSTELLNQAMRGYIQDLDIEKIIPELKQDFSRQRKLMTQSSHHARIPEVCAWLLIGLERGLRFMMTNGVINESKAKELLNQGREVFIKLAERQAATIEGETPVEMFRSALTELLANKKLHLNPLHFGKGGYPDGFVGWFDDNWIYLLPGTAYNEVTNYYKVRAGHIPVSEKILWQQLEISGYLQTIEEGGKKRRVFRKAFSGSREQIVQVRRDFIEIDIPYDHQSPSFTD